MEATWSTLAYCLTQQDTLNIIGDPANGNRFTYTGDDLLNNTEPRGTDIFGAIAAVSSIVACGCFFVGAGSSTYARDACFYSCRRGIRGCGWCHCRPVRRY